MGHRSHHAHFSFYSVGIDGKVALNYGDSHNIALYSALRSPVTKISGEPS